ncbi:MAG: 1-deoxy-D-xylulose-5-phosphate reductoisomerase [Candidatus Omnitrophica bacterium]|nr:1-deoxy-D-xylulose-5-phosphate reductoisomerase [Candidatus Omnitrophota bacterium]
MKNIAILGSTGSIGTNTLRVIHSRPEDFRVIALSAYRNMRLLAKQIKLFQPELISVKDEKCIKKLEKLVNLSGIRVCTQDTGLMLIAKHKQVQTLVVATAGTVSLVPTLLAIEHGKTIALANKEPLVMAGEILMRVVKKNKGRIIPVDSEHSAIFQCLRKEEKDSLRRIYLTGTGGPFRNYSKKALQEVNLKMALKHPKWKMGQKITIDSATLMNKGLELIEARWLFDIPAQMIEIVIHPQALIHSMVEFCDHSILAQLGVADMRLPIQYALDYPKRTVNKLKPPDFFSLKSLTFFKPDLNKFPCLGIARKVAELGGSAGCVMNAANEIAVEAFLNEKINFLKIPDVILRVLEKHKFVKCPTLDEIFSFDEWARREAGLLCHQL